MIEEDTIAFCNWAQEVGLKLNILKAKAIIFGHPRILPGLHFGNWPKIVVKGSELEYETTVESLGLWLGQSLT